MTTAQLTLCRMGLKSLAVAFLTLCILSAAYGVNLKVNQTATASNVKPVQWTK